MNLKLFGLSVAFAATLFAFSEANAADNEPNEITATCGDMSFRFTPNHGISLRIFDIQFIKETTLWVVTPGWASRIYGAVDQQDVIKKSRVEDIENGKRITIIHELSPESECPFSGKQIFTMTNDNTFTSTLEYNFTRKTPAIFEWGVGCINPLLIIGKPYTIMAGKQTSSGIIPTDAESSDIVKSTVAKNFSRIELDSRIGKIEIISKPEQNLIFFDYRKNRWAQSDNPFFWLGFMDEPVVAEKTTRLEVKFRFPASFKKQSVDIEDITGAARVREVSDARKPAKSQDFIIPAPKRLSYTQYAFPLTNTVTIFTGKNPGTGILNAVDFFLQDMKEFYNLEMKVVKDEPPSEVKNAILLGEVDRFKMPATACTNAGLPLPEHPEGYSLMSTDTNIYVAARTEKGVFYGITTLLQLVGVSEGSIVFKGAQIQDYPSLDFRGIHCLSGKNAGEQIAKAIRTLMARFKINSLVWECEYIIWDAYPEIEHPHYGMTKDDARKVIAAADKYFFELIPLIQSLGHSEWIFVNDHHLDLAEDPEMAYAYNPTNPATYEFIFTVYQEAIDLFKPRYFHIGHDEVTNQGRFPYRSRSTGKSATDLIMEDIMRLHEWFSKKDITVMLWGDMFLWKEEGYDACHAPSLEDAQKRRALLPRDVVVTDWHYEPTSPEKYTTLKIFKDMGVKVIGAGWFNPNNIRNLAKACVMNDVTGYLQTTWAGFNFMIDNNEKEWRQYWAYIWAANYAWTGENTEPEDLPFSAERVFMDLWSGKKPLLKPRKGVVFDLHTLYNRRLEDDSSWSGWAGIGTERDLSTFPLEREIFNETRFTITKNDKGEAAILLAGKLNPPGTYPREVTISMEPRRLSELHILMTAAFQTYEGRKSGEVTIMYTDGTHDTTPLLYGKNIFAFDDERTGEQARIAWRGRSKSGKSIGVWDLFFDKLPEDKSVKAVRITSECTEAAPIILAMTGVD